MNQKAAVLTLTVLFSLASMTLEALTLDETLQGLPREAVDGLEATGEVFRLDRESKGILLLPEISMAGEIRKRIAALEPDVFTEALYLIPYPDGTDGIDVKTYNITRSVSSISDVIYLSARKKKFVPLFDNVYAISDMKKKTRIDDPLVSTIPATDSILMHMKEVNLGRAFYRTDYLWDGESLGFFLNNLTNLRAFIKVVGKNNMQINLIIIPTERGFLVYGACAVKLSNSDLVFDMMDPFTGFYRRLYAMVTWIYNTMHGTDRLPDYGDALNF